FAPASQLRSLTPSCSTPANLCCCPVNHRFEETWWESFEADLLVGIVWGDLHQVVASVGVNLNGVITASCLVQDLFDRAHLSFDTFRRIELAEDRQQRSFGSAQRGRRIVEISAPHESPERLVAFLRAINVYARLAKPFFVFGRGASFGVLVPLVL